MKTIERLRLLKKKATDRMEELVSLAKQQGAREMTADEKREFDTLKAEASGAQSEIEELERMQTASSPILGSAAVLPAQLTKDQAEELASGAVKKERERCTAIRGRVKTAGLTEDLANALINEGVTLEAASTRIFEELAKAPKGQPTQQGNHSASVGTEEREKKKGAMTGALLHRMDAKAHPAGDSREFIGLTMLEMARICLENAGVKTIGMSRDQVATAALIGMPRGAEYFAGNGMMSTSDLPNILTDAFNKRLRMAYEAAPRTYMSFAKQATAPDFKTVNVIQMSDISAFQKVNEHGEFKAATLSDSKETYKLVTYGEILRITRQTIINDDLRALDRANAAMGTAAARLENETVWGVITANANMGDGVALFHATHKNLNTGAGTALAAAGLASGRTAMRTIKGPKGQILNIVPKTLLVPAALENTALQLVNSTQLFASAATNIIPEWIRSLTPVVEPLLDANSTAAWYLAGDPGQIDTVEYCYLEGQEGVYLETRNGFDVDGVEIKARLDFAAAPTEFRGLQKNVGS